MSKEKQIEEMAMSMCDACVGRLKAGCMIKPCLSARNDAEALYKAGYRKQSEGEWITEGEFFMEHICSVCGYSVDYLYQRTPYCPNCGAKMKEK